MTSPSTDADRAAPVAETLFAASARWRTAVTRTYAAEPVPLAPAFAGRAFP